MARDNRTIRNIGIIAHIDAGKTTVTERMLFYSGAKHRVGEVDKGTTETDVDPEEQERGITIYSACVTFRWKDVRINLLDTPGHVDFTAEVERCLRVLDGAVVVFSAREGVEAQSETVWRQADKYSVPRVAFINKMDREGAEFERVMEQIGRRLAASPVAVQVPVGQGPAHLPNAFRGVVDLVTMRMLTFSPGSEGKEIRDQEIPPAARDYAELWRESMLEKLYEFSDELMGLALQEEPIPPELIRKVLRDATLAQQIQPVLCGSALHGIGVQPVLDAVMYYLPCPLDRPPIEGISSAEKAHVQRRRPDASEPFCGLVFKVLPARTGDMTWVRVYSGTLRANTRVLNANQNKKDNVAQLWQIHATKREKEGQVEQVETGDIVGVIGLRHSVTGDTLCDAKHPILLETIRFPDTVISMAIEPESTTERKKLEDTLEMLKRQDPTVRVVTGETGQTLLSGMGELHLEVIKNRLLRDFNLSVKFHKPQVSYRETIGGSVEVDGECHRQIGGKQLFARLRIRLEPFEVGQPGVVVASQCPADMLPPPLLATVLEELKACGEGGGLIGGFPLMNIRATLLSGEAHAENSDEVAFRIATHDAFEKGLRKGQAVLLEPIMKLDISTMKEYLGDIVGDLQHRRGIIDRTEDRGGITIIEARAPLSELFGYSSSLRSLSQGRASCSMSPLDYSPAPPGQREAYAS